MKRKSKIIQILDCTIRDGGYLNNWAFDPLMVREVYRNVSKSGVDFIELGFRNTMLPSRGGGVVWRNLNEQALRMITDGIKGASIALMLDFGSFHLKDIPPASQSLVTLYRLACHKDKVISSIKACEGLHRKGYLISLQLMGITSYHTKDFNLLIPQLKKSHINYVYFSDTYGSLYPEEIPSFIKLLKKTGKKIGYHAHNNLQLAFANTLAAIQGGVDIIDATIYGMGRGSGNVPTEILITYLEKKVKNGKYDSVPLLDLIDRYFIDMKKQLDWGYSLPYMLSGIFEVHPNYPKELIDAHEYDMRDISKALEAINGLSPVGFDKSIVDQIVYSGFSSVGAAKKLLTNNIEKECRAFAGRVEVSYANRHQGRDFLILGNGPSLQRDQKEIRQFIKEYDPIVLGANYLGGLFIPDYHAFSNRKRFMKYINTVSPRSKVLMSSTLEENFIREYYGGAYERLVHLNRLSNDFEIHHNVVASNCRTIAILLMAVATVMGANRVFVVGMDGYLPQKATGDPLHFYKEKEEAESAEGLIRKHNWNQQLMEQLNGYLKNKGKEPIRILTSTSYRGFYSPIIKWLKKV